MDQYTAVAVTCLEVAKNGPKMDQNGLLDVLLGTLKQVGVVKFALGVN